jgi:methylornithine synthase
LSAALVERIAARASEGLPPTLEETAALVALPPGPAAEALFEGASALRDARFGKGVFLYGFVYLSTHCRNNCSFCHFRSELGIPRYRKAPGEILEAASRLAESGVHLIDLTMGEDPAYLSDEGFEALCSVVSAAKRETGLPVMLSPGLLPAGRLAMAKRAGADWYALYHETHNRGLFAKWRRGQSYDGRWEAKKAAVEAGLLVEEGLLLAAGASPADVAESISLMGSIPARQVRAMTYVPSPGGLPPDLSAGGIHHELATIAALRLWHPEALIPASLDVEGLKGLLPRIRAGANVVTSLVPAGRGFGGVASKDLDVDNLNRGAAKVAEGLAAAGRFAASAADYRRWLGSAAAQ